MPTAPTAKMAGEEDASGSAKLASGSAKLHVEVLFHVMQEPLHDSALSFLGASLRRGSLVSRELL